MLSDELSAMSFSDELLGFWSKPKRRVFIAQWEQGFKGTKPPIWPIFKYVNLHYQQTYIYTPDINLTKIWPSETFSFWSIGLLVLRKLWSSHVWTNKYNVYSQNTHTFCVYFDIKFSGLSPIYPKWYLWLCAFNSVQTEMF